MTAGEPKSACSRIAELLVFYVCDEVNEQERAAIERHLAECAACRAQFEEERDFREALVSVPQAGEQLDAAGILLSQCRSELAEKLDDLELSVASKKVPAVGWLRGWMVVHPAWSAAALVLLGLLAGKQYAEWSSRPADDSSLGQVVSVRPSSQLTEDQLSRMAVAGINFSPSSSSGSKNVRVRLNAEQPIELDGNLDDSNVRNVLTFVVKNGDRFDSGLRLDCLDALKMRTEDAEVRSAFLAAARKDQNPAVRLKALEALRNGGIDGTVREALLDALQHDSNTGVRVEAVNLLVRSLEQAQSESPVVLPAPAYEMPSGPMMQVGTRVAVGGDGSIEAVVRTLEDLQHNDPSRYVRLRSAAALREISARNDQ